MFIDIRYGSKERSDILSNLAKKPFIFRGIHTNTIEGILQSLKTMGDQTKFWSMNGHEAKKAGRHINWQESQVLWWGGNPIDRHSEEYQVLLDELFSDCYAQNKEFRDVLHDTVGYELLHSIGNTDPEFTILTVDEFISRLVTLQQLTIKTPA